MDNSVEVKKVPSRGNNAPKRREPRQDSAKLKCTYMGTIGTARNGTSVGHAPRQTEALWQGPVHVQILGKNKAQRRN
jgi:hypothetical protein